MRRREFIAALGGAVAWPIAAGAQQPAMPVVGFLHPAARDTLESQLGGFRQGLKETGFIEGENMVIEYHRADDQVHRLALRSFAVIATVQTVASVLKATTATIPILFVAAEDPVKLGLVANLARPEGNLTGTNFFGTEAAAKRLELLRQLAPGAVRVTALLTRSALYVEELKTLETAAGAMGLHIQVFTAETVDEIDTAFAQIGRFRPEALFVGASPFFTSRRIQLVHWSTRLGIPAIFGVRLFVEVGGLMSYGASIVDAWRQVGAYAGRILKGARPADLPVMQATKFELVINHQIARVLGLTLPPSLLATADEVIE